MECISQTDVALLVAILTCIAALLVVPEVREWLHLNPLHRTHQQRLRKRRMTFIIFMVVWVLIGLIAWHFVCPLLLAKEPHKVEKKEQPVEIPLATPPMSVTPTPTPTQSGPVTVYPPVTIGPEGKRTQFTLYVFTQEYHWKKSTIFVEFDKRIVSEPKMISYLSGIHGDMKSADALICVGTASTDVEDNEAGEEDRALMRALQLVIWTRRALKDAVKSPDLYALNLGHYREPPDTDEQRLIIVVGVKKVDAAADLENLLLPENGEALKARLKDKGFPFNFDAYSAKFEPQKRS
jgi:hypothetical protein